MILFIKPVVISEAYLEPTRTSTMEIFPKIVNGYTSLSIFAKTFNLDVWLSSEYASVVCFHLSASAPSEIKISLPQTFWVTFEKTTKPKKKFFWTFGVRLKPQQMTMYLRLKAVSK